VPAEVEAWLAGQVRRGVAVEFDRFIAAGQLERAAQVSDVPLANLGGPAGMGV
jgi:hypothetical protein